MTDYFRNFQINGLIKLAFGLLFIVIGSMDREIYISVLGAILILITVANKGGMPWKQLFIKSLQTRKRIIIQ